MNRFSKDIETVDEGLSWNMIEFLIVIIDFWFFF